MALAGAAAGLGFWTKGPVGLVVPALALLPYLVTERRRVLALLRPAPMLIGLLTCVVVALPWYVALALHGRADVLRELFIRQNITRFVEPWDHAAPFWYYLAYFFVDMAPWAFFVLLAPRLTPDDEQEARLHRQGLGILLAVIAFFSLSLSKRSPYILPVAPASAALASGVLLRFIDGRLSRGRRVAATAMLSLLGALFAIGTVLVLTSKRLAASDAGILRAAHLLAALTALAAVMLLGCVMLPRLRRGAPLGLLAGLVAVYLGGAVWALPAANRLKSSRAFCQAVARHVGPAQELRGFHEWPWRAGYSFYLSREIPNLSSVDELRDYLARSEGSCVIVERGRVPLARQVIGDREPLEQAAIGDNHAYLFCGG
jgi:4-amino-4-deoxy-L-arabinose transferase